jgi:CDP-diacylglycerol--serine O-phosphatidyltransferase
MKQSIPNLITLGNLACGLLAITFVMQNQPLIAFALMVLASILDFFDGMAARALGVDGELGKQLDSLADVVSFGVVPGLIWRHFMMMRGACPPTGFCINSYVWMLIPLAAAYRLAVFNVSENQKTNFMGIPTPLTGLVLGSWAMFNDVSGLAEFRFGFIELEWLNQFYVWLYMPLIAGYMMVSDYPMLSLKFNKTDGLNLFRYLVLAFAVVFLIVFGNYGFALFYFAYIGVSFLGFKLRPIE